MSEAPSFQFTHEQRETIANIATAPIWHQVLKPYFQMWLAVAQRTLAKPPEMREGPEKVTDDYLRVQIMFCTRLLEGIPKEASKWIETVRTQQREREEADLIAATARYGPGVAPLMDEDGE